MKEKVLVELRVLTAQNGIGPFPAKQLVIKCTVGTRQKMEYLLPFFQSFLQLSSAADSEIITLYEDKTVKIIPVVLAKDAMQLKSGLLYDSKQGKLIRSTFNLNYGFVHKGKPDKETLKASMVQAAEVMCLATVDAKFAFPVGVNH